MNFKKVKIITFVPLKNAEEVRQALGHAGAGVLGEYSFCSYSLVGTGRFLPSISAHPYIGEPGKLEVVQEERIEVTCDKENAKKVITVLKQVHPYEEVAFDISPLISEEDL